MHPGRNSVVRAAGLFAPGENNRWFTQERPAGGGGERVDGAERRGRYAAAAGSRLLRGLAGEPAIQLIEPPEACHIFRDQVIIGEILVIQTTECE